MLDDFFIGYDTIVGGPIELHHDRCGSYVTLEGWPTLADLTSAAQTHLASCPDTKPGSSCAGDPACPCVCH